MTASVSVIGAGTAGLIAAKRLSELGVRTMVYDQKHRLGHPARASGILSIKGLASLGIDPVPSMTNTLRGAILHAGGKSMKITAEKPVAHVLDRIRLNEYCRDEAERAGAEIETGRRIGGQTFDELSKKGIIIGADGAVSATANHFLMGPIKRFSVTYKAEYNISVDDPESVDLFFDNIRYHGLFAWLCPNSKDILEVGVGVDSAAGNGKRAFDHFIRQKEVSAILGSGKRVSETASIIPMSMRNRIVDQKNRVLLVGDSAGQVKETTGGGIIFGGNAALIAADTINRHIRSGSSLDDYRKEYMRRFGMEMKIHSLISRFYTSMDPKRLAMMISFMEATGLQNFLGEHGDMDMPSTMIKRFFLRGLAN